MGTGDGTESSLLRDLTGLYESASLAGFLEVAFDAVVTFDERERITSWNPAAERMFGWTLQEALGKTPADLFWPVDLPLGQEDKKQRLARMMRGETLRGELTPCRKDGSTFPARFTARAIFDAEEKLSGYLAVYRDISSQVQAREKEEQLRRSNQKLNEILASIQDDFYVLNRDWVFVFASRTFTSRIGKEPEDFIGNNIWEMFPKHVGTAFEENLRAAMEKREVRRFEIPGKYTNAWYRMNVFPSAEGITVIGADITELKKAEESQRMSEQRLQRVIETDAVGVLFFDPEGYVIQANDVFLKMTGYTRQQIERRELTWRKMTPPEWIEESKAQMERFARTGRVGPYEKEYFLADGSRRWMLFAGRALGDGTISEYCIDVSGHKRTEAALRQSQKTFQELIERAPFGIYVVDSRFRIAHMNASSQTGAFRNVRPVIGRDFAEAMRVIWSEEIASGIISAFRHTLETGEPYYSPRFTNPRRDVAAVESYEWELQRMTLPDGQYGVICYYYDSTKLRDAEIAVRESERQLQLLNESLEQKVQEKTEEVRRLASDLVKAVQRERHRISHILHDDLQQRIYAIQIQLTFLQFELQKVNETAYKEAADIEKQIGEVLEITRNLSIDLSPPILRDEGLAHAIHWLAGQMRQRYGLPIEVQADESFAIPDEELHVFLFNCVREFLFNVVKHAEASRAVVSLQWSEAGLQIEVGDDGKGFPINMPEPVVSADMSGEEDLPPSFGLPTIRQQLSLFGGHMEIQTEPGEGTHVILIVPVAERA